MEQKYKPIALICTTVGFEPIERNVNGVTGLPVVPTYFPFEQKS